VTTQGARDESSAMVAQSGGIRTYNVDDLVPDVWPEDVVNALDQWKQGDLVQGSPRFWAGPSSEDPVLGTAPGSRDWEVVDDEAPGGYVVVTSQTCDIAAAGPGRWHPFVDVSPVFEVPADYDANKLQNILKWEVSYLVPISPSLSSSQWVADLRLSMPISKGLLASRSPIEGFATEEDRLLFGEAIAIKKRRPALADVISYDLPRSLSNYIKTTEKAQPEWWQHVEQVRLRIKGDRLRPSAVALLICEDIELSSRQRKIWRDWRKQGAALLRPHRITLDPVLFQTIDDMKARLYRETVPLRIPELGRPPVW